MPRRRRQPNGQTPDYGTQPVRVPTGQPYGQAKRLAQAQQAIPLPDLRSQSVIAEAEQFDPFSGVTSLAAPSRYPGEPVTTGLPMGAGPGPEVLSSVKRPKVADTLLLLAETSGDPELRNVAMRAFEQGV